MPQRAKVERLSAVILHRQEIALLAPHQLIGVAPQIVVLGVTHRVSLSLGMKCVKYLVLKGLAQIVWRCSRSHMGNAGLV